jgi:hypothetical protein
MKLPSEFMLLEVEKSDTFSVWTVFNPADPGDPRVNFRDEARYNKKVRLLRCTIVEVLEEQ